MNPVSHVNDVSFFLLQFLEHTKQNTFPVSGNNFETFFFNIQKHVIYNIWSDMTVAFIIRILSHIVMTKCHQI